jgi:hypothetical protein
MRAIKLKIQVCLLVICCLLFACNSPAVKSKNFNNSYSKAPIGVIEIVGKIDTVALYKICRENNVPLSGVYQWHNHVAIYTRQPLIQPKFVEQLTAEFSTQQFKFYYTPFYHFERLVNCNTKAEAQDWDNILLTANLVADPKMQQEYLDYHKTQFEKWPEVSNGFCNAWFQQLLVFKNGRQLMLIISIPKGKSLDKLNPLTTKNNPRVDDWNKLMSKYQEGIPGTKKGESWVFLKPVL